MNTAGLMDRAIYIYQKSFWKQLAYAAIVGLLSFVGLFVMGVAMTIVFVSLTMPLAIPDDSFFAILVLFAIIFLPPVLLWQAFSGAGHIMLAKQAFYGVAVKIQHYSLPSVALRVFTSLLAQVILLLPFFALVALFLSAPLQQMELFLLTGVFPYTPISVFIFGLIIIFGLFAYTNVFSLAMAVAVFEEKYFMNSIRRSWQLIQGEFWKILGVRLLWYLVGFAFSFTAQGMVTLVSVAIGFIAGTAAPELVLFTNAFAFVTNTVTIIVGFVVLPMDGIMQAVIYFNQRIKREGFESEIKQEKESTEDGGRTQFAPTTKADSCATLRRGELRSSAVRAGLES